MPSLPPVSFPPSPLDTPRHQGLRAALVRHLSGRGLASEGRVLAAIGAVPRHLFFPADFPEQAYLDKAFPIGDGQTISQPYTVAYQTALLAVQPGHRVLEIGTGSGYQGAVLLALGAEVYTVELVPALAARAAALFARLGLAPHTACADGSRGWPDPAAAPFDRILVTAAAPHVPPALLRQLAVGGVLVVPVGPAGGVQRMLRVVRESADRFRREEFDEFRFVPLRGAGGNGTPD